MKAIAVAIGKLHGDTKECLWYGYTDQRAHVPRTLFGDVQGKARVFAEVVRYSGSGKPGLSRLVIEFADDYTAGLLASYVGGEITTEHADALAGGEE